MMKMKLKNTKDLVLTLALAFLALGSAYGAEVDRPELETVGSQDVVFINYNGPYAVINTVEEINGIGRALGDVIRGDAPQAGSAARYRVLHVLAPEETGLAADIFILGENAGVDHIRNLRRIIASYLSAAYGYSAQDASTLAAFVTVYNAVYRGNIAYFSSKYKNAVVSYLEPAKAGLALNYSEWPGKTQILIPVSDPSDGLSAIDTSIISDQNVIESLRGEEDKGIGDRKQMVDIKEREADAAQEKADTAQKAADEEKAKQTQEEAKLEEARKDAQDAREQADAARAEADKDPGNKEAAAKAEEAEEAAQQKEEAAADQEKAVEEQTEKAGEAQQTADQAQERADTKREEAKTERDAIASDQAQIMGLENAPPELGVYGLRLIDDRGLLSAVVKVNTATGRLIKESPVKVVRSRTMYPVTGGIIAIAGVNTGNGAVKLVILDTESMEIVSESKETVAENSVLETDGSGYYAVIQDGSSWVIGKYNAQLQLQVKSPVAVNPATPIVFTASGVTVTGADGNVKLLRLTNLAEVK